MKTALLAALLSLTLAAADGYHILCVFAVPTRSQDHLGKGIVKALLRAGHEVTWVTPYPADKKPEKLLHIIDASANQNMGDRLNLADPKMATISLTMFREISNNISATVIGLPALREAMLKGKFDAVATESFLLDIDAGYAAALQIPWILLAGVPLQPYMEAVVDEVRTPPVIPTLFFEFPIPMNLWQRAANVAVFAVMWLEGWWSYKATSTIYEDMFKPIAEAKGVALPEMSEAVRNISIVFTNSHSSFSPAQSLPPNVIEIGGYHIDETIKPLPKDLQDLMDSSTQGVVYFSMGSVFKSANIPLQARKSIIKMLGSLPYTVLWKFETDELKDLPKNLHVRPWMPQAAILAHKNTKVFITHGGLSSTLEILRYGVPAIVMPVFGDQPANAAKAVSLGYALRVDYNFDTMAQDLNNAVNEILGNDKYYKKVKLLSSVFNNRPVSSAKLIPYYVELAIETQGAHHLRSKALLYTWYQRWMLDIAAILLAVLFISYYVIKKTLCFIYCKVTGSSCKKEIKKDSKKVKRH